MEGTAILDADGLEIPLIEGIASPPLVPLVTGSVSYVLRIETHKFASRPKVPAIELSSWRFGAVNARSNIETWGKIIKPSAHNVTNNAKPAVSKRP